MTSKSPDPAPLSPKQSSDPTPLPADLTVVAYLKHSPEIRSTGKP